LIGGELEQPTGLHELGDLRGDAGLGGSPQVHTSKSEFSDSAEKNTRKSAALAPAPKPLEDRVYCGHAANADTGWRYP
jgi:hypothetical protein